MKLLDAIVDLDLGNYQDADIDTFGDAYEHLMTMYASSAGKSEGEFFTQQEVSELIARLAVIGKIWVGRVYTAFRTDWIQNGGTYVLAA